MNDNETKKPNGFLWMDEWAELTADLTAEQIGILLIAVQNFHLGNPYDIGEDKELKVAFRFISACVKKNDEKYANACERKRQARERQIREQQAKDSISQDMPANAEICQDMPANADYQNTNESTNTSTNQNTSTNTNKKGNKKGNNSAPKERTRYEKIFEEVYQKRTGNPFAWSKRECIAINAIIGKIANMMIAQNKVPTDQDKEAGLRWFLEQLYNTGDAWIISNFVPHIIDTKFNEFYNTIKNGKSNGKQNTNPYGVSEQFLADLAREFAGGV